jgi:hypothetical protein
MSIKEALHESVSCVTAIMRPMYEKIEPLMFGEHRRMLSEGEEYAKRLLKLAKYPNYDEIAAKLVENYPVHDFCVDLYEAGDELGLNVEILQSMLSLTREGYYGFIKRKKTVARKKRTSQAKGLAVIAKATAQN